MSGLPPADRFIGLCPTTGKRMYSTRKLARAAARSIHGDLSAFECDDCGHFHMGHHGGRTREQHRRHHQGLRAGATGVLQDAR